MGISRSKRQKRARAARPASFKTAATASRTSDAASEDKPSHAQNLLEKALARWENEGGLVEERSQPCPLAGSEPAASQAFSASQSAAAKSVPSKPGPYKEVVAAALDPIITIDSDGIIQSASDSVERVFGWTSAELVGRNVCDAAREAENNTQLHELLAEQTSALEAAHLRLRMSDRMASIGALAAGLGHDMNNVLLPVRAHLNAARALTMIPEVRRHVTAVQKSVTYLQQLADALHFLALDTDGEGSDLAATDVRDWWSQVGPLLTKAVPKHVKVTVSLPKGLPQVAISAQGLTQAVLNLIVNAGQAIPVDGERRKGRVRIWAEAIESGRGRQGGLVRLSVSDNGVGMSPEIQRNAFEMFYTTKTRGLGTGLGLPLVARVVKRAGGSIHIESELGKGAIIHIVLPAAGQEAHQSVALAAVVTLADSRAAVLIHRLLEVAGIPAALGDDATDADIWIVEPMQERAAAAKAWRKRHPRGSLILFGKPDPSSARSWKSLRPVAVEDPGDLDAIRAALGRAVAGS